MEALKRKTVEPNRRKRIFAVVAVVTVLVTVLLLVSPHPQPEVIGNLPREDVSEITRLVRAEMRRDLFPTFSWRSVRELPSKIRRHWSARLLRMCAENNRVVEVMVGGVGGPQDGPGTLYLCERGTNRWEVRLKGFWWPKKDPNNVDGPTL